MHKFYLDNIIMVGMVEKAKIFQFKGKRFHPFYALLLYILSILIWLMIKPKS